MMLHSVGRLLVSFASVYFVGNAAQRQTRQITMQFQAYKYLVATLILDINSRIICLVNYKQPSTPNVLPSSEQWSNRAPSKQIQT